MLEVLARAGSTQTIHLIYGVTRDLDLVLVDEIEAYAAICRTSLSTVVAEEASTHPKRAGSRSICRRICCRRALSMPISAVRRQWSMPCAAILMKPV